jgi:hypothetical protein
MKSRTTALIFAAVASLPLALSVRAADAPAGAPRAANQEASSRAGSDRQTFVGTYRLVTTETKDASGKWTQTPNFNSVGYITYSDTGYMAVQIMPKDRPKFAGNQPTPEEAQKALQGYSAYYGPFTVDERGKFVIHKRTGQLNPGGIVEAKRFYDFVGNKLILTPGDNGITREKATRHLIWERLPNASLSAEGKKFVGFRKLLYTDRYTEKAGKMTSHDQKNETRAGSVIIYTPTGHMMVHLMNKEGRTKYAGTTPTPDEALAAYRSYNGYFGRFTVHENENPRYVVHHQEGTLNPGRAMDAKRFYELKGNVLRLGGPPTTTNDETSGGHLYWEMLPPLK